MAEGFTCAVDKLYLSACKNLPKYPGSRYCVLHEPEEAKDKEDFEKVKKSKLDRKDYDFGGAVFPAGTSDFEGFEFDADVNFKGATFLGDADFTGAQFSGERTHFSEAQFRGEATFFVNAQFSSSETANFEKAQFNAKSTYFEKTQFRGKWINFGNAQFRGEWTHFSEAQFSIKYATFYGAQFSGEYGTNFVNTQFSSERTDFTGAQFSSEMTDFELAQFREKVFFVGTKANSVFDSKGWAWFFDARIEKPELLTFNTVLLHPGWFINNPDVRKIDFTDVKWYGMPGGPKGTLNKEIDNLKKRAVDSPHYLLAQACRRLSANAEENREYPIANEFYYWSMNALRKAGWRRLGLIGTLYWALSGYGVRAARAFGWLVVIWVVFALIYMLMGSKELHVFSASEAWKYVAQHIRTNPLGLRVPSHSEIKHFWADVRPALVYSLGALARLRPEPQPDGPSWFQFFVTVEGILGPLQVALLALAIRRKVMR